MILTEDDHWCRTWNGLEPGHRWQVTEPEVPEGYTVSVSRQRELFAVTNSGEAAGEEPAPLGGLLHSRNGKYPCRRCDTGVNPLQEKRTRNVMTRNTAREIAAHLSYELSFTDKTVDELLKERLTPEAFAELAGEDSLYADAPNAKQAAYITRLVKGVDVSGSLLPDTAVETASDTEPLTAFAALIAFQQMRHESSSVVSAITEISLCYELQNTAAASMTLVPSWQIVTDTAIFYVNCISGTVRRA